MNRDLHADQPPLAPPQVYEMNNLRTFDTLDSLLAECKKRQQVDADCWMPVYRLCCDAVLFLLPGLYSLLQTLGQVFTLTAVNVAKFSFLKYA